MKNKVLVFLLCAIFSICIFATENQDVTELNEIFKQKNFTQGITKSKAFIKNYPNSKQIISIEKRISKAYYISKDYKNAITSFENIIKKYILTPEEKNESYYYISKSYILLGNEITATEVAEKIDRASIYYERSYYDRAVIYLDRGEYKQAFDMFKNIAVNGNKLKNAATFNMALTAYNDDHFQLTIDVLNEYVPLKDRNRDEAAILYIYGTSYYKLDDLKNASKYFEELVGKYPNTEYGKKAKVTLIEIYLAMNNIEKVEKYWTLTKGKPEELNALATLGDFYAAKGQYEKALEFYKQTDLNRNPRALYGYAYSLYNLDRVSEALENFKKLEATSYYNQSVYYQFASYYKLKDYKKILEERKREKRIVVTQQDNDNINLIIANAAYEMKDFTLAQQFYASLNLHRPSKENLYRAVTLSGRVNKAADVWSLVESYKKLYPNDKEYKKKIYIAAGEALYNNGNSELAEQLYEEFLSVQKDPDIFKAMNALLVNEKKYGDLKKYLDGQDDSLQNIFLRGVAFTGIGKYNDAEVYYKKVLFMVNNDVNNEWYIKAKLNMIKNYFLGEKYQLVINEGLAYLQLQKALEKEDVVQKIGISYYRLENYPESRKYFERLAKEFNKVDMANIQIADSYMSEKNYTKAKEIYKKIYDTSIDPDVREVALFSLAKVADTTKNLEEYKKYSAQFLKEFPESGYKETVLANYLRVSEGMKDNNEEIKTYTTIYNNSKDDVTRDEALEKLIRAYIDSKNYSMAESSALKLKSELKQTVYLAQTYEAKGDTLKAALKYEALLKYPAYKEYATVYLGKYYFNKKDYAKSRKYFADLVKISGSKYQDLGYFQVAVIDEINKNASQALKNYKIVYTKYPKSIYMEDARMKVADLTEKTNINEALIIYGIIANTTQNKAYKGYALEKLVYHNLKAKKVDIAKDYYNRLLSVNKEAAAKYVEFFPATGGK
ncbi:MAG: tetratricopeptide repeat protein [Fusobacteriaceae bacterium]